MVQAKKVQKKVQKSTMKAIIKEVLLDLLESGDEEILEALDEILSTKAEALVEARSPKPSLENSKPQNGDLFDRLVEVASGEKPATSHNGKKVKAPAKGVGFQGAEKIKLWATEAYTKLGGSWIPKGQGTIRESSGYGYSSQENVNDTNSMLGNMSDDYGVPIEAKINHLQNSFKNDKGEIIEGMDEILRDTAMKTLQEQKNASVLPVADAHAQRMSQVDPEALGEVADAGNWAGLAFFDQEKE